MLQLTIVTIALNVFLIFCFSIYLILLTFTLQKTSILLLFFTQPSADRRK